MFPPVPQAMIDDGYQDFADRWNPILDVFDAVGRAVRARGAPVRDRLRLLDDRAGAGGDRAPGGVRAELGPVSHFVWQDLDPVGFLWDFHDRIYHVDCKDAKTPGRQRPQRPARLAPAVGRPAPRLGLRLHRARRRAVGGTASGCSTRSATTARSRSSGRTPAWTGCVGAPEALEFVAPARLRPADRGLRRRLQHPGLSRPRLARSYADAADQRGSADGGEDDVGAVGCGLDQGGVGVVDAGDPGLGLGRDLPKATWRASSRSRRRSSSSAQVPHGVELRAHRAPLRGCRAAGSCPR